MATSSNIKTRSKLFRTQIYLPANLYKNYTSRAKQSKISTAELIRRVLQKADNQDIQTPEINNFIGMFKSKAHPDAALNHNDIYEK